MGLDTSHDAWHGAYGAFSRWRHDIAVAAGIIQKDESLYYVEDGKDAPKGSPLDWDALNAMTDHGGNWSEEPEDPIWYLLNHSDCDGVILHKHTLPLALRLKGLIPLVDNAFVSGWYENRTKRFVRGLMLAHEAGEDVDFH